jgi:hypothetical protein
MPTSRTQDVLVTTILSAKIYLHLWVKSETSQKCLCGKSENPTEHHKFPEWQTKHNKTKQKKKLYKRPELKQRENFPRDSMQSMALCARVWLF